VQKSLALGMIKPEFSKVGTLLNMDILGKMHNVEVIEDSPYDPENKNIKT
jgi:dimethylglycine dehydrogenase